MFAERKWIHSALDGRDIDKWGRRLGNEKKGQNIK